LNFSCLQLGRLASAAELGVVHLGRAKAHEVRELVRHTGGCFCRWHGKKRGKEIKSEAKTVMLGRNRKDRLDRFNYAVR
jgi:hypothetical protein